MRSPFYSVLVLIAADGIMWTVCARDDNTWIERIENIKHDWLYVLIAVELELKGG